MQCKWCADKRFTWPRIKKNKCRWTKNYHYTWDYIQIGLSFISSHGENLSLCSRLRSLSTLRSKTILCLKLRSDSRSYRCLTKTLDRGPMLAWLSNWTRITQDQAKLFDVPNFSAVKTHMWHTIVPEWNCLQFGHLSAPKACFPLKAELVCEVPSFDGCGVRKD